MSKGIHFDDANLSQSGHEATRRHGEKLTVASTGPCRSNTEGKLLINSFVKQQGADPSNYQLTYKGNQDAGLMALYVTKPGDKGVMNVTQYRNAIAFHAGACFKEFPRLRPAAKVDCHIEEGVDAKGVPCIIVHVTAGTPTRTVKQKKKSDKKPEPQDKKPEPTDDETQDA